MVNSEFVRDGAKLCVALLFKLQTVGHDVKQYQFVIRIGYDVWIILHVYALKHKRYIMFFSVVLDFPQCFGAQLLIKHSPQVLCILSARIGLCCYEQVVRFCVVRNDSEESVLLYIGSYRERKISLERIKLRFFSFIDIEELIVSSRHDSLSIQIDVQATGFHRLGIPCFFKERAGCEVERGDIAKTIFIDVFIATHLQNQIPNGLRFFLILTIMLVFPEYRITDFKILFRSILRELNHTQAAAELDLTF